MTHNREQRLQLLPMLRGIVLLPLVGLAIGGASPAIAETAIQNVGAETARGTTETSRQLIVLGYQGVNLNFSRTGETIKKVWLDDPTQVVIDFDGCLDSGMSGSGANGNDCGGATIIHLRQLPGKIDFPAGYFAGGTTTQLTVITQSATERKIYQFKLALRGGTPPYSTIDIIPAPPPAPAQLTSISQEYQQTVLRQLSKGLAIAESKQLVDRSSSAYQQVVATIALMQGGKPFAEAIKQTGVPNALVDRLRAYGSTGP